MGDIIKLRKKFWGDQILSKAPSESDRKTKMNEILYHCFNNTDKIFYFNVGDLRVCERGFLILLGLNTRQSRPPRNWVKTKAEMLKDEYDPVKFASEIGSPKTRQRNKELKRLQDPRTRKYKHANTYIQYVATVFSDTSPTKKNIRAVPYESVSQLYEEYQHYCKSQLLKFDAPAGREVFRQAFKDLGDSIKLVGAKG